MAYVNSVTVYPSSATVTKGKWYYGAYASIASDCPECAEVEWYSNSPSIAGVNKTTGYIYGVSTGTTRIYAEATDGSGKKDYITVTVTAPVSVTGVSVCPTSLTMNVGDTDYLCETVHPSNATNQTVTWCSSDDSVAEVNTYSGKVTAKKAGVATITVCTVDGGYSASCTVTAKQVLTGADLYIDDVETRNLIMQYKTTYDYIQSAYLNGTISICQKNEQQNSILKAMDIARADYVILNPQSNFVYQYFKGRNRQNDDLCPFVRESYTYPNDGYNDPKDMLAIIIIQRSLELLGYFEPCNGYEYGIYDHETHDAVLTSPFYVLGSNDFQKYSYYDMLGSTTLQERTKSNVKLLHKMRLFHNEVADWVALKVKPNSRTHNTTIYKNSDHSKWGFADVMKTDVSNEYIWEVKPWSQKYRDLNSMASVQLSNYINAWNNSDIDQKYLPRLPALPGYNIGKFAFRSQFTGQVIVVESNPAIASDIRSGLVHYYPTEDDNQYQKEYAAEYALETSAVPVKVPTVSYDFDSSISFGTAQVTGMAEINTQIFVIVIIGMAVCFVRPELLSGLLLAG